MDPLLGVSTPGCCPEGVFLVQNPEQFCGCNDNAAESPYRLDMKTPLLTGLESTYDFDIVAVAPGQLRSPVVAELCGSMDIDRVRLYIRPEFEAAVSAVTLGGKAVQNVTYGSGGGQTWIELMVRPAVCVCVWIGGKGGGGG